MPIDIELKKQIESSLMAFHGTTLRDASIKLLSTLGYTSDKTPNIGDTPDDFLALLKSHSPKEFDETRFRDKSLFTKWKSAELLFQLTDDDIARQQTLFDSSKLDASNMQSYVFFAIELSGKDYPRGAIANIARQINRVFPMPVMVLVSYDNKLTVAIINRRPDKRKSQDRDVLGKVTLIKDIDLRSPHRAHTEILFDLSIQNISRKNTGQLAGFVALHAAWSEILNVEALNKRFYSDIANWYFWSVQNVEFPNGAEKDGDIRNATSVIRLITRLIFCWFMKEKNLIPEDIFLKDKLNGILQFGHPDESVYYKAILQNLFFATLNTDMSKDNPKIKRRFRNKVSGELNTSHMVHNVYRYEKYFKNPANVIEKYFEDIPFLNGGLFECLDKSQDCRVDGFSDRDDNVLRVPDALFFGSEHEEDLNAIYGTKGKKYKVCGLMDILNSYKFTIAENTPVEEEIALDPELLGRIFENLLASYNPETKTTARKQTGSFYTPRPIVEYMLDESLKAYLEQNVAGTILSQTNHKVAAPGTILSRDSSVNTETRLSLLPYNPEAETIKTHANLPHWSQKGTTYWITFRLADSMPQEKLNAWKAERDNWAALHPEPWDDDTWKEYNERFGEQLENWLDAGEGECHLKRLEIRSVVEKCLSHFDGDHYELGPWVIMPNHVHLLLKPNEEYSLSKIMQGIKDVSSKQCNALLGRTDQAFWQDEFFDHIVRSFAQYERFVRYIKENPLKAKLREGEYQSGGGNPAPIYIRSTDKIVGATLRAKLDQLFSYTEAPHQFSDTEVEILVDAIDNIKILDPACGSSAFPMGILHKLVHLLAKLDPENKKWMEKQIAKLDDTVMQEELEKAFKDNYDDYGRKLCLIENCIYGIDIQPVAIQISKLRCFISLLVDQRINRKNKNFGIRPLPNLETKFVVANTLIGVEKPREMLLRNLEIDNLEKELAIVRKKHFNARSYETKTKYRQKDKELRAEIAKLLIDDGWGDKSAQQIAHWDPYDQNSSSPWFDPEWMFGISDGFDIVIGNPPYVSHDKISDKISIKRNYRSYEPFADIYCYFIEKSINTLRLGGILTFITSNSYLRAEYGNPLRKFLRSNCTLLQIIDIEDSQVFQSAIVNVAILISCKAGSKDLTSCKVVSATLPDDIDFVEHVVRHGHIYQQSAFDSKSWNLANPDLTKIQRKIESSGRTLEQLGTKIRLGLATGNNEAFVIDESKKQELCRKHQASADIIQPLLRGRNISRYVYQKPEVYILLTKNGINVKRDYPAIYKHLDSFGESFRDRGAKGQHWTNLRACSFFDDFKKEKIIWIELTDVGRFAICTDEVYLLNSAYFLLPPPLLSAKYLLSILNSSLIGFYLKLIAETSGMGTTRWINNYVKEFPIPEAHKNQEEKIEVLADKILSAKKNNPNADTSELEKQIDHLVYQLYSLTEDEIKIVERAI
jgi:REP element-mobilizing transposase RayT